MIDIFGVYFQLGFQHISDLEAYDHILFVIAMCSIFPLAQWKRLAWLVTAFTVGHSITLAMSIYDILPVNELWIEILIPFTIIITSLYNVLKIEESTSSLKIHYLLILFFGFIHGMGFSSFLRATLLPSEESQLVLQLLAFNLGVEVGQLFILAIILIISHSVMHVGKISQRSWNLFISGGVFALAFIMLLERLP
jgi:hypothetical protein